MVDLKTAMIEFTESQFREIKAKGEQLYRSFHSIYCPYFREKVTFDARGLKHLKFKKDTKIRSEKDQYMRFKLLSLAPEILRISHTLQGVLETQRFERIRMHSRTETILKPVKYYEFIAVIKRNRVKVIAKQIGNGQKIFWSIIPFWKMNELTKSRLLHEGMPEED